MEPPNIPDNRSYRNHAVAPSIDSIDAAADVPLGSTFAQPPLRSDSPAGQAYEPPVFGQPAIGQPAIGRPTLGSRPSSASGVRPGLGSRQSSGSRLPPRRLDLANGYQNGHRSSHNHSMSRNSVAESTGTLDLGHHSIGQPQTQPRSENVSSPSSNDFDQESISGLSMDQQSIGNVSLGHHSIGGAPGSTFPTSTNGLHSSPSTNSLRRNFYVNELPMLQQPNPNEASEQFKPIIESSEEASYDLVAPYRGDSEPLHSLEHQAEFMFCSNHMLTILNNPQYLAHFREFLNEERPGSMSTLTYYLNALKSVKAIEYANAIVRLAVDVPTAGVETAQQPVGPTVNMALENRVKVALDALTAEELPAFITSVCINITSKVVEERVRGTLPAKFQGTADALAEVFCLTDPSRPDNPIIFASSEFHRTTQYGMDYVLGRNCRFLQGPKTNPNSTRRIREALKAGRHHSELFLNYRRDGSPFMNLLQMAPLRDSSGKICYFIGAQIDVSGLAMEGAQMESLLDLKEHTENPEMGSIPANKDSKPVFQELGELLSPREIQNFREHGGNLFQPVTSEDPSHRLFLQDSDRESETRVPPPGQQPPAPEPSPGNSLIGVYRNYLLVRPYPSLRILFTSPSLQIPGILQSSFLSRIGDEGPKRDHILHAMMNGRSVTARIKWVTKFSRGQPRNRWIHCTPLMAHDGQVGVWIVIILDDDEHENMKVNGSGVGSYPASSN